jgi:hypothetical protein
MATISLHLLSFLFWLLLHSYDQIQHRNNIKEERFILAHCFRGFRLSWWVAYVGAEQLKHHGGQKAEKTGYRKKPEQDITSKAMPPLTYFLQLDPTHHISPFPNNAITLHIYQGNNPFIRSEPS